MIYLEELGQKAKKAYANFSSVSEKDVNIALNSVANALRENKEFLQTENAKDVENAKIKGKSEGFIDRLTLTDKVINGMADGIDQIARLSSPTGKVLYSYENKEQGIFVQKKNVPFGVIGIIFESRPNVTADAFALCFKTGNAVILKGGSDSINSNVAIVKVIKKALKESGIDDDIVSLIEDTSRETATEFLKLNKYVDLIIPRGGASLIKTALDVATIPIIETGLGNCHIYVDETADIEKSNAVIINAKTQRYSVCNACESLVIHSKILDKCLKTFVLSLAKFGVEVRCDERAYQVVKDMENVSKATDEDFYTEYGGPVISVKTVDSLSQAIAHINEHSTRHSESIMTENIENAEIFKRDIDSAVVYHNASTRFSDGFVFGLGAEIGISTQKLHARGPMGLDALVTTKYVVTGNGAVRK